MSRSRFIKVVGVITLVVVAIAGLVFWNMRDKQAPQKESYGQLCHEDDIGKDIKSEFFEVPAEKSSDIKVVVDRILSTQNHDKSVNCLFVLAKYNSNVGLTNEAVKYYDELIQLHKSDGEWVDETISQVKPSDVEALSTFLKEGGGIRKQYILNPDGEG